MDPSITFPPWLPDSLIDLYHEILMIDDSANRRDWWARFMTDKRMAKVWPIVREQTGDEGARQLALSCFHEFTIGGGFDESQKKMLIQDIEKLEQATLDLADEYRCNECLLLELFDMADELDEIAKRLSAQRQEWESMPTVATRPSMTFRKRMIRAIAPHWAIAVNGKRYARMSVLCAVVLDDPDIDTDTVKDAMRNFDLETHVEYYHLRDI